MVSVNTYLDCALWKSETCQTSWCNPEIRDKLVTKSVIWKRKRIKRYMPIQKWEKLFLSKSINSLVSYKAESQQRTKKNEHITEFLRSLHCFKCVRAEIEILLLVYKSCKQWLGSSEALLGKWENLKSYSLSWIPGQFKVNLSSL